MLIFKSQCPRAIYAVQQLHYLLGIEFIDDIQLITNLRDFDQHSLCPTILVSPEINESEQIFNNLFVINTNILNKISDYFSLDSEKNMPRDSLNRVIFPKDSQKRLKRPIIDIEIHELRRLISSKIKVWNLDFSLISFNEQPIVCLTHDVDSLKSKSWLRVFFWILSSFYQGDLKEKVLMSISLFKPSFDEHGAFKKFIQIEESFSFKSTYFFLSLPFFMGSEGRRYRINKKSIKKDIWNLIKNGFEIGLHTSRKAMTKRNVLEREIARLSSIINTKSSLKGVRNHYLAGSFQDIWSTYEDYGFIYDSTLGWHDYNGYRSGTSMPFIPYNSNNETPYKIYELPQIIMDGAIQDRSSEEIFQDVKFYIDYTKKHNSVLTISWHTNRIISREFNNYSEAYVLVLKYLKELNFISLTAAEIIYQSQEYVERTKKNLLIEHI